jgi:hypothetical protein
MMAAGLQAPGWCGLTSVLAFELPAAATKAMSASMPESALPPVGPVFSIPHSSPKRGWFGTTWALRVSFGSACLKLRFCR